MCASSKKIVSERSAHRKKIMTLSYSFLCLQELDAMQDWSSRVQAEADRRAAETVATARAEHDAALERHLGFMVSFSMCFVACWYFCQWFSVSCSHALQPDLSVLNYITCRDPQYILASARGMNTNAKLMQHMYACLCVRTYATGSSPS